MRIVPIVLVLSLVGCEEPVAAWSSFEMEIVISGCPFEEAEDLRNRYMPWELSGWVEIEEDPILRETTLCITFDADPVCYWIDPSLHHEEIDQTSGTFQELVDGQFQEGQFTESTTRTIDLTLLDEGATLEIVGKIVRDRQCEGEACTSVPTGVCTIETTLRAIGEQADVGFLLD